MTRFILVRHGETDWNRIERFRGRADLPLSPVGLAQAEAAAQRIAADWSPAAAYTSPLTRAVQTAQAIASRCGLVAQPYPDLVDIDYGAWQGLTPEEVQRRWPRAYHAWYRVPHVARIPDGETLDQVKTRAIRAIIEIGRRHEDQTVVVVSHTVVNRTILLGILETGLGRFWHVRQDTAALNVFESSPSGFVVVSLNDTCHLRSQPSRNGLQDKPSAP